MNWIDPTGFTEKEPEGTWYSGFSNLFSSAPILAVDANPTLIGQLTAVAAAMDLPNGNDAPNSSGCPDGTGTAPRPCAAPGEAGCIPLHQREPPTVRQAPPETLGDYMVRVLMLEVPPDEIVTYSIAYNIKHGIVNPVRRWVANEPYVYLDADHNVRTSSIHRDYSHEMAPVLGEVALMVAPGANALARSGNRVARGGAGLCFAPGTRILMADGSTKPIEEVYPGDLVLTDDPNDTEGPRLQQVTETYKTSTYRILNFRNRRMDLPLLRDLGQDEA